FNPLKERGLERFQNSQVPVEMLSNGSKPTNTAYLRPALGGDMAVFRGMAKYLLQWERDALANEGKAIFDRQFISEHTTGIDEYLAEVDATTWEHIAEQSG
ncbi:CbbBc protein, partial [Vibrio sp. 10N.286.51.F4]